MSLDQQSQPGVQIAEPLDSGLGLEPIVSAESLGKRFKLYPRPIDRLIEWGSLGSQKRHTAFWGVRNATIDLQRGETLGVIGANGAGKTTLLRMLAGISTPTEGKVVIRGRIHALIELRAGFEPGITGRQNIRHAGRMLGYDSGYIRDREDDIVNFADIGPYIDQPITTYSSGMFARLSFALMVFLDPDALLIDETLAVGDEAFKERCFVFLDEFVSREDRAALIVSHSIKQIRRLCRRVAWIDRGEIQFVGPADQTIEMYEKFCKEGSSKGGV